MTARPLAAHEPWPIRRLGDVLYLEYGDSLPEAARAGGGVPVIGSAGHVGSHNEVLVPGPGIVIGRKGSIGHVTWVPTGFWPIDTTYYVRVVDGEADLRWAFHLLQREDLRRLNRATGVPGLNRDDVYALPRPIPPISEQRAIAAILESIDGAIERTEEVIAATEELRQALLQDLLTRGVPGWHTEWKHIPGIGTIPADWEVVRLGDVARIRNGTTPSKNSPEYWLEGTIPFMRTGQVNDVVITRGEQFITKLAVEKGGAVVVPKDSVLIAMIGQGKTRGMAAKLQLDAAINQNFAAVTCGHRLHSDFFFVWASQNYERIRGAGHGSNQEALNCQLISSMRMPLPPLDEQRSIAVTDEEILSRLNAERDTESRLRQSKHEAATLLLSGRVRVPMRKGGRQWGGTI